MAVIFLRLDLQNIPLNFLPLLKFTENKVKCNEGYRSIKIYMVAIL